MRRLAILAILPLLAASCAVSSNTLYNWGSGSSGVSEYEQLAYSNYKTQTPEDLCKLLCVYEKMVSTTGGLRNVPPPGICAEYGYLLLLPKTAETFAANASASQKRIFKTGDYHLLFLERGKEMLQKELELYPESEAFVLPLLKKLAQ